MTSVTSPIEELRRYRYAMREFPQGASWPHAVPLMVRAAAAGVGLAFKTEGLPIGVDLDSGPGTKRQIRRMLFFHGSKVNTIKLSLFDSAVIIGGRTVYLKGEGAGFDLVEALLDAIDASAIAQPIKKRGRPPKAKLTIAEPATLHFAIPDQGSPNQNGLDQKVRARTT